MRTIDADVLAQFAAVNGKPVSLVAITLIGGAVLRYTDYDASITVDGNTYSPRAFAAGEIEESTGNMTPDFDLTIDDVDGGTLRAAALGALLKGAEISFYRVMLDSSGDVVAGADGMLKTFSGEVENAVANMDTVQLSITGWMGRQMRTVPNENFGPACRFVFGGAACAYAHADRTKTAQTVDAGSTSTVIADAARTEAANWWAGGYIEITSGDCSGQRKMIASSASGSITLAHPLTEAPAAGDTYSVYQQCDKTYATCRDKFSNEANFGGFQSLAETEFKA